ncbi:PAS domain S-box protein [Geomesophilobacter sediminis]|uniref:histidine kinase n=1 Tax=Geomesophilobacter sediminis TaxID=2798584 RepID=A0A8J7M1F4_9BACT|nr:PAS domain S-box protein [Geomesophilobacter sediminis]MBJ6726887.1 PAS domain S-box protein [Geomesophilobacter sediminis]
MAELPQPAYPPQRSVRRLLFFPLLIFVIFLITFLLYQFRKGVFQGHLDDGSIALIIAGSMLLLIWSVFSVLRLYWRRETDVALRENEERLRISQRIAHIGSWDWDLASDRVDCTDEMYRIFGLDDESFPRTYPEFLQLLPPEDRNALAVAIRSALYGGAGYALEHRVFRPDGSERIVFETGEVFHNEVGEPLRVVSVVHDITERKQAESALSFEKRYRALIENLPQAIYLKDRNSYYVSCNSSFARELGMETAEVFGKTDRDLFPEAVAEERIADDARVMAAGLPEERDEWRPGANVWVSRALVPLKDQGGTVYGLLGVATDITDRKLAEERLKESEERFRITFEQAAVGICHLDLDGVMIRINRSFCNIIGYDQDDLLGRAIEMFSHPDDLPQDRESVRALVAREIDKYTVEKRYLRADGSLVWVNLSKSLAFGPSGEPRYFIAVVEDITEKRAAEALRREHDLVKAESLAKSRFLANMSHEIRTPMNAIIGMSLLALKTNLTVKQRGYLEKIHASSRVLLNIINDTLEFSRFEAGRIELEHLDFDPCQVLKSVHDIFSARAAEKGISLRFLLDPELPRQLVGDALRLTQVLGNLVGNAVKFTEHGGVVVGLTRCGMVRGETLVRFFVRDSGLGIPAEQLERIFTPFTQVDSSTTRRFGGTGLGLSISRQLVEMMEGTLEVESEVGSGSTFSFTVSFATPLQQELLATDAPLNLPAVRVMVEGTLPTGMHKSLKELGFEVKKGAGEAMLADAAAAGQYDLVLYDCRGRSREAAQLLYRTRENRTLAGLASAVLVEREELAPAAAEANGLAHRYIGVPCDLEALRTGILRALIHREAQQAGEAMGDAQLSLDMNAPEPAPSVAAAPATPARVDLATLGADSLAVARELAELERLLAKNSLDAKKQYHRLLQEFPPEGVPAELQRLAACLDRLDFRRAREIVERVGQLLQ